MGRKIQEDKQKREKDRGQRTRKGLKRRQASRPHTMPIGKVTTRQPAKRQQAGEAPQQAEGKATTIPGSLQDTRIWPECQTSGQNSDAPQRNAQRAQE